MKTKYQVLVLILGILIFLTLGVIYISKEVEKIPSSFDIENPEVE